MATSESEDFESADEDLEESKVKFEDVGSSKIIETKIIKCNVKNIDTSAEKLLATGSGDVYQTADSDIRLESVMDSDKQPNHKDQSVGTHNIQNQKIGDANYFKEVPSHNSSKHDVSRRRQQKTREPKTNIGTKKLGTRISSAPKPSQSQNSVKTNTSDIIKTSSADITESNHYQKPPTSDSKDAYKTEYTEPPDIVGCWEEGVDNIIPDVTEPSTFNSKNIIDSKTQCSAPQDALDLAGWEDGIEQESADIQSSVENKNLNNFMDRISESSQKETGSSLGWGGWSSWGVTSLLSTATESVATLSTHVSQGLSTVLETGIGAPDPEEFARLQHEEKQNHLEQQQEKVEDSPPNLEEPMSGGSEGGRLFDFSHLMSGMSSITKLVETTGTKVITGGLDTLETIGKKTMEVLQEGDPGLKKKRALFSDKIELSQILREAKERAEQEDRERVDKQVVRAAHFETLFDDHQGLVHLEALEMLSKQCDLKLQSTLLVTAGPALAKLQASLQEVKDTCQLPDDDEDEVEADGDNGEKIWRLRLDKAGEGLGVPFNSIKLITTWEESQTWLRTCLSPQSNCPEGNKSSTAGNIHQQAILFLARLTAAAVEQFHKIAEMLLVKEQRDPKLEADTLLQVTAALSSQVSTMASGFCEQMNSIPPDPSNPDSVNALITNIFLEASNSSSYIQEAFQLLVPVLQVGVVALK
uniref:Protein FAM114A2 n=1 Tax=Timema genevievae TaxID=629358 RepID=A0A7R9PPP3_TIMGE|nr:unnamed protein product [Timema genevievae]